MKRKTTQSTKTATIIALIVTICIVAVTAFVVSQMAAENQQILSTRAAPERLLSPQDDPLSLDQDIQKLESQLR